MNADAAEVAAAEVMDETSACSSHADRASPGALIHPEAEQKRKDGDRPDRVEGLIESRIQNRMRSRGHDIDW